MCGRGFDWRRELGLMQYSPLFNIVASYTAARLCEKLEGFKLEYISIASVSRRSHCLPLSLAPLSDLVFLALRQTENGSIDPPSPWLWSYPVKPVLHACVRARRWKACEHTRQPRVCAERGSLCFRGFIWQRSVLVSASSSLSPRGPGVTAVRKQIDFSPPTYKQLTTSRSIRNTL